MRSRLVPSLIFVASVTAGCGRKPDASADSVVIDPKLREEAQRQTSQFVASVNHSFDFIGRVEDAEGAPLAGVAVWYAVHKAGISEDALSATPESNQSQCFTDSGGTFRIEGMAARFIVIRALATADGSLKSFPERSYSPPEPQGASANGKAMLQDTFILVGEEAAAQTARRMARYILPTNGREVRLDATTLQPNPAGSLSLIFIKGSSVGDPEQFPWQFEVKWIDGGVAEATTDRLPLRAPVEGYLPNWQISYAAGQDQWADGIEKTLVFKTAQGGYGLIRLRVYADAEPEEVNAYLDVFWNTAGKTLLADVKPEKQRTGSAVRSSANLPQGTTGKNVVDGSSPAQSPELNPKPAVGAPPASAPSAKKPVAAEFVVFEMTDNGVKVFNHPPAFESSPPAWKIQLVGSDAGASDSGPLIISNNAPADLRVMRNNNAATSLTLSLFSPLGEQAAGRYPSGISPLSDRS